MKLYNYIFFKLYQFFCQINDDMSDFLATMTMSWLLLFNSYSVLGIIEINNKGFLQNISVTSLMGYAILILVLHYIYFLKKDRYMLLIAKYKNETKKSSLFGGLAISVSIKYNIGYSVKTAAGTEFPMPKIRSHMFPLW